MALAILRFKRALFGMVSEFTWPVVQKAMAMLVTNPTMGDKVSSWIGHHLDALPELDGDFQAVFLMDGWIFGDLKQPFPIRKDFG